jgi:hypothetical protein
VINATFTTSSPHIISRVNLRPLQKANHTSFNINLSRFKIHETLLIKQSNFLNFKKFPYEKGKL